VDNFPANGVRLLRYPLKTQMCLYYILSMPNSMKANLNTCITIHAVTLLLASSYSYSAIVYADNFDGAATTLIGTIPDSRPGSQVWGGSSSILANGSFSGSVGAYLPLTLEVGNTYELSATIQTGDSWSGWIAMGFIEGDPAIDRGRFADNMASDWFLIHVDGRLQYFKDRGGAGEVSTGQNMRNKTLTYVMEIDTRNASASNWTLSGSLTFNGNTYTAYPGTNVSAGSPTNIITGVGFGAQDGAGTITNFSLSIPEPSTYAALSVFGLAWTMRRRRVTV
jgi:hypothetical protein